MNLSLQNFSSLVQSMAATVQAGTDQILNFTVGSTVRSILEGSASIALWMQWLILQVLQTTRAATSSGSDLDTWVGDFSLTRLPASPASGVVTFSRFNSNIASLVPTGSLVKSVDGSQVFTVIGDIAATGWSEALNGYLINVGANEIDIPVVAAVSGTTGNVQAGAISMLATAIAGVDKVSNSAAFQNGLDAESDVALRNRFQTFISSRSRATLSAVEHAIRSVQQGLNYTIQENAASTGRFQLGNFLVTLDDGSGYPSAALLSMVYEAIDAVRPVGSTFSVFPPVVVQVNASLTLTMQTNARAADVVAQVMGALTFYIDSLTIGMALPLTKIAQIAYSSSSQISNVTSVLLNGAAADVVVPLNGVIKAGTIVVS